MEIPDPTVPEEDQRSFEERLLVARQEEARVPPRRVNGRSVAWAPQPGSQTLFLAAPFFEVLFHGTRGPGKTDALLMAFAQHVGRGHGAAWRGIIFRQTYPQLADVQAKSEKWFHLIFGKSAKFNKAKMQWEWSTGEALLLRHMNRPADYWNYHGHEYPFIGWEELTNWASPECYLSMFSCCRCSTPGVPRMVRATTNPYGPGHAWVKDRWRLHAHWWRFRLVTDGTDEAGRPEPPRASIHGHIDENLILLKADPHYKTTIIASASNPAMAEAWLDGSWEIVAGGMFDDVWSSAMNVVASFDPPRDWRLDRALDWGSSAPFSVGWWAESNGSDVQLRDGSWMSTVRGDLFRVAEWYGWNGRPNQGLRKLAADVARGIVERELSMGWQGRVVSGPADNSIMTVENGMCIARDMSGPVVIGGKVYKGVSWVAADKRPGSRMAGWELMRRMMAGAHRKQGIPREHPGLFVVDRCEQFLRTVPSLPRDEKNMDDVDTSAEDHIADETRYRCRASGLQVKSGRHTGMY